jgi:hypothetical protein
VSGEMKAKVCQKAKTMLAKDLLIPHLAHDVVAVFYSFVAVGVLSVAFLYIAWRKGIYQVLVQRLTCGRLEMGLEENGASDVELDVYSHFHSV